MVVYDPDGKSILILPYISYREDVHKKDMEWKLVQLGSLHCSQGNATSYVGPLSHLDEYMDRNIYKPNSCHKRNLTPPVYTYVSPFEFNFLDKQLTYE